MAEELVYYDHLKTFYCQCDFVFDDVSDIDGDGDKKETMVMPASCGYSPRKPITSTKKPNERISRIEWEHVVPAEKLGGHLDGWMNPQNYPQCQKSDGKFLSGRDCAYKVHPEFKKAHNDLMNLVPAVGELNGDRSNHAYGEIPGEERAYGKCDFENDFATDTTEPSNEVKGDIARIYFYMSKVYSVPLTDAEKLQYLYWDKIDPLSNWELSRYKRIKDIQATGTE